MKRNRINHLAVIVSLPFVWAGDAFAQTVNFPDHNLEAAVRDAIPKPSGDITVTDMLTLTMLNAEGRGIVDTTGLETAANLTNLVFNGNPVTNYTGFVGLANLVKLRFDDGAISNLAFLSPLTKLETLEIYRNQIQDITPLAGLTGLKWLQLDWNPVTNHAPLGSLTKLVSLYLAGTAVTNLDFVLPLQNLQDLGLYDNHAQDISALTNLASLRTLQLGWNGITNAPVLALLSQLEGLWLNGNALTNVPFLAGLTNLTRLGMDYTELVDMSPATNLTRLTELNVGENHLANLPDLSSLTNLTVFMMAGNDITDLTPIAGLSGLRNLHLQRNLFHDVSPLMNCVLLETLLLSGNTITNLAELDALTNLWSLELREMSLPSVDFAASLTMLHWLDAGQNRLTDLSSLTNLPWLESLDVEQNHLSEIGPLLDMPTLHYVDLKQNVLDTNATSAAWNVVTNLVALRVNVEYDPQLPPPVPLQILAQPLNCATLPSNDVTFSVTVTGGTPAAQLRWQKNGSDLADDGRITGTETRMLQIDNVSGSDSGLYRVRIWDDWMETNSFAAELKVITNVVFADPNLEQAVRDGLGIPTGPIMPEDFLGVTYLTVSYRDITNLSGLEAAVDLEELDLGGNSDIQSFKPLSFLSQLNNLHVYDCRLDDLGFVTLLPSLTALDMANNFIEDLSPLTQRPGLQYLDFWQNELTQVGSLLDLPQLVRVRLPYNRLDTNATSAAWNVISNLLARGVTVEYDPQRPAPVRPQILTQPSNVGTFAGQSIQFHVAASSGGTLHYQWLKDGVNVLNGPRIAGAWGDTLWMDNVQAGNVGSYRVRVWDEFGVTNSRTVVLQLVTSVVFADPHLEQAVRDRLGIPNDLLTPADLATMDGLDAYNYGITNLGGIENAANLYWVVLGENPGISDFSPLNNLYRLQELYVHYCGLTNISFVTHLPLLRNLDLGGNEFADLSPVTTQTQLRWFSLGHNPGMTNLDLLATLTELEYLSLPETGVSNITFAASLPNLRLLDLWGDEVQDLTPLMASSNLVHLELNGNKITNAWPLASCTNLEWFSIGNNPLNDLSFVTNLLRLTDLYVANLGISNLSYLAPLTNLVGLGVNGNGVTNLPPYPHLNQLRHLNLDDNPLAGIRCTESMTNLLELYISRTGTQDLSPLTGHTNLQNLGLAQDGISDITPMASLSNLRWVTLYDNRLTSIDALAGLTNLNYVDLRLNYLGTNAGSASMLVVQTLQGRGTQVDYLPQKTAPTAILLSAPTWLGGNQFRFTISSEPGAKLQIWSSTDLSNWSSAGFMTNTTGTSTFTHSTATNKRSFYRAQQQ